MDNHWKELLPVDRFQVYSSGRIQAEELKMVTLLYQPLVGAKAYSLYMTLFSENLNGATSHHTLMNQTQMNMQQIFEERKKLEAIGLLKTYRKRIEDDRIFIYELQPILKPEQFFQDDVLSVYLYGRLGKQRYLEVRNRFILTNETQDEYEDVTASFNDVFSSLHESEIRAATDSEIHQSISQNNHAENTEGNAPNFSEDDFDFNVLVRDLSSFIIPSEVLTESIRESIHRLAFIYQISPLEMSSIVQQAYFRDEQLTPYSLRQEVQRWYKIEKPGQLPRLSERRQKGNSVRKNEEELSPQEMMIKTFETISPRALLEKYSEGGRAASADLKLIDSIMFDQKLSAGVINVLIDYVLNTNDMKLIHAHVEKIASQWKRKKISSVREAMELAKAEHKSYQSFKQQKSKAGRPVQQKNVRKDKLPKWMATPKTDKESQQVSETDEKWLEEYLKGL
ncbi:replication initiation and membrane attachment family protein [Pseudalkalibacillus sp. R45]|uniref:replication initiation and membrane attachment family protein n=1 Tax=Pseudalkalibacillus sp. R45 TaxID=3457433 RepID=UPI003FCDBA83